MPLAETIGFDKDQLGAAPAGWICGVTGRGSPKWGVRGRFDRTEQAECLEAIRHGNLPMVCKTGMSSLADGFVEVKFKPLEGKEDRAGGVMWRWKDGDNYYVARANALENNVSLYHTTRGSRRTIRYVDAPVPSMHGTRSVSSLPANGSRSFSMAGNTSTWTTITSQDRAQSAFGPKPTASRSSTIFPGMEPARDEMGYPRTTEDRPDCLPLAY